MRVATVLKILAVAVVAVIATGIAIVSSIDVNEYRGDIAEQAKAATGRDLNIDGQMDLSISLSPAITVDGVRFANAQWGSGPDLAKLGHASVEVSLFPLLFGDIQVNKLILRDVDVLLETDDAGKGNWVFDAGAEDATTEDQADGGAAALPWIGIVEIQNLRVRYRDGTSGDTMTFALDRLVGRSDGRNDPLSFELAGTFNDQAFSGQGTTGALSALGGDQPFPYDTSFEVAGAKIALKGSATMADGVTFDADVSANGENLADLGAMAGTALPPVRYRLAAHVGGSDKRITLSGMQSALGDSNLAGEATIALDGPKPHIAAKLTSSLIDVDGLVPPGGAPESAGNEAEQPSDKAGKRVFPADPLPLDGLHAANADIQFNGGEVRAGKASLKDVAVTLTLKDGTLAIKPFSASVANGTISNQTVLKAGDGGLQLDAESAIAKLDFGQLLKEMDVTNEVAGVANGRIKLTGSGASVRELMAGLNGTVELVSGKGRIKNDYLALASADVLGSITPFLEKKDASVVNCMVTRFDIRKGMATSKGLIIDTETLTISGEGTINLATEELDMKFTPQPKETSLMNLSIPILAGGTLAEPSFGPDPAGTAKAAAGAALTFVNPLVALAPLVVGALDSEDNPCVQAAAGKGGKGGKTSAEQPQEKDEGGLGGLIKGLGKTLGNTLGKD